MSGAGQQRQNDHHQPAETVQREYGRDGSLCEGVPDPLLTACSQQSNHLGPFSEEWKHVSQVKDIVVARVLYLWTLLSSLAVSFACLLCVGQTQTPEIVPTIGFNIEKFKNSR